MLYISIEVFFNRTTSGHVSKVRGHLIQLTKGVVLAQGSLFPIFTGHTTLWDQRNGLLLLGKPLFN